MPAPQGNFHPLNTHTTTIFSVPWKLLRLLELPLIARSPILTHLSDLSDGNSGGGTSENGGTAVSNLEGIKVPMLRYSAFSLIILSLFFKKKNCSFFLVERDQNTTFVIDFRIHL